MDPLLIEAPVVEPVSLEEAKLHLRVDHDEEDDIIGVMIQAARETAEQITGRSLATQTWEVALDAFPGGDQAIPLANPRVQSIVSVTYTDTDGAAQTVDPDDYVLDADAMPGFVRAAVGFEWPATQAAANAVRVQFVSGYGDTAADVPAAIKAWMLLHIGTLYGNRESVVSGGVTSLRFADTLLDRYKVWA